MLSVRAGDRDETGAVAILIAISMIVLLGIAAIAIDLGAGFSERRQDQTASDLAAVAGALSFGDKSAMVAQVLTVARVNLGTSYTDAEWQAAWQSCTDPGRTAAFLPMPEPSSWGSGTLDCISLSPSFLRVRVPVQETDTTFGRLLGVDSLSTDAYAVVTVYPTDGQGALPFAVIAGAEPGEICLDTGPGGTSDPPCNGPSAGSFGNIAPPLFGNTFIGTQPECDQQTSANNNVAEAIAMGIDHVIWDYPSDSWTDTGWSVSDNTAKNTVLNSTVNMDLCNEVTSGGVTVAEPADGVLIDGVVVDTGNNTKADVTEGLISSATFSDGGQGRLWRTSHNTIEVWSGNTSLTLDNEPLWAHLLSGGTTTDDGAVSYDNNGTYAPASCNPTGFAGPSLDDHNIQMGACLTDYADLSLGTYSGQIFGDTIMDSPRFGVAPQLWHDNLGNGLSYRPVKSFRQVYLAGVWFDLKAVGPNAVFYPGYPEDPPGGWCPVMKGNKCAEIVEIEQLSAFLLDSNMVSFTARTVYPGVDKSGLEVTITE